MFVKVKKVKEGAQLPQKATAGSAAFDIIAAEVIKVNDDYVICKTGLILQFPENYRLVIVPRSNITKTNWIIQNSPCTGDSDYDKFEYEIRFKRLPFYELDENNNLIIEDFPYTAGQRVAQCYFEEIVPTIWIEEDFSPIENSNREGGFGSTGNN